MSETRKRVVVAPCPGCKRRPTGPVLSNVWLMGACTTPFKIMATVGCFNCHIMAHARSKPLAVERWNMVMKLPAATEDTDE